MIEKLTCSGCGGADFSEGKVLWPELISQWQLTSAEVEYIDRQQGVSCTRCGTNLRANALGNAVKHAMGISVPLDIAVTSSDFAHWRILDLNGIPGLSTILGKLPNYVRGDFPDIDMHALPFEDHSFDLVIHSDTLEHVAVPALALQECRRVLRPLRRLCFTAPIVVGRLTRNRTGLPPSYHGSPDDNATDFIVHTEFGADIWTMVFAAGFSDLAMTQLDYPSAIAISAWVR